MPRANSDPKRSSAFADIRSPRQAMTQKQASVAVVADQSELLADDRKDEVGVREGQVKQLLHAFIEPAAGNAAGADGDERLDGLEPVALPDRPTDRETRRCV